MLFPDFKRLYLELKQMGMVLTINTNGILLDEEWVVFLQRINYVGLILRFTVHLIRPMRH